ncbi:unnamed protein product [Cuscuta epithymum]|uniref:Uncharacterized protein n=1 Tax=Cuscuta epithymum TaxID=186058 RepID=A0AAV0EQG5_9ASTE|nr:unnamed protein product [Cuscuta epithymum]
MGIPQTLPTAAPPPQPRMYRNPSSTIPAASPTGLYRWPTAEWNTAAVAAGDSFASVVSGPSSLSAPSSSSPPSLAPHFTSSTGRSARRSPSGP